MTRGVYAKLTALVFAVRENKERVLQDVQIVRVEERGGYLRFRVGDVAD